MTRETAAVKNLVLGLVKGYTRDQISPFIASLRATGYGGDVCLMCSDVDDQVVRFLHENNVETVPFTIGTVRLGVRTQNSSDLLERVCQSRVGRAVSAHRLYGAVVELAAACLGGPDGLLKYRIAAKTFNVYCVRYPLYYLYLARHRGEYANVLITDVRDVIFQRDPFDFEFGEGLAVFLEDERETIGQCRYNSAWLRAGYGDQALRDLGAELVSCSGVTYGTYNGMMRYLERMVTAHLRLRAHPGGMDQGVHNYLLHKKLIRNVRVYRNGAGPVLTMGKTVDLPTALNTDGQVLNTDGSVANVLHQYDRHVSGRKLTLDATDGRVRVRAVG